jgi:hypothetical protein
VRSRTFGWPQPTLGILFQDLFYCSGLIQVNLNSSVGKNSEGILPTSSGDKSVHFTRYHKLYGLTAIAVPLILPFVIKNLEVHVRSIDNQKILTSPDSWAELRHQIWSERAERDFHFPNSSTAGYGCFPSL